MPFADSKQRFSNRVADYVRYRPGYPSAVREILRTECGLKSGYVIADIGSGTGFLSELFLKNGNRVFGVEPNEAMRQAGEEYLASYDGFASINGSAESTTLDDLSVNFVTAGQAFHWFDQNRARTEFVRILKPAGWVVVIWNERLTDTTPFLRDYESLLRKFGTDYASVKESYPSEQHMRDFFGPNAYASRTLPNFPRNLISQASPDACCSRLVHPRRRNHPEFRAHDGRTAKNFHRLQSRDDRVRLWNIPPASISATWKVPGNASDAQFGNPPF